MPTFIGDVHGKYRRYKKIISEHTNTIQVGDMGVGFIRSSGPNIGSMFTNPPHYAMKLGNHRFIRGNHDNPSICKTHSQCIPDGTIEEDMMFIGGASSIDKHLRKEGYDWWPEEELSIKELDALIDIYIAAKPKIMVTHTCPEEIVKTLYTHHIAERTEQALQSMWSAHSPELWVFGHHHQSLNFMANGTLFVCLNELEIFSI